MHKTYYVYLITNWNNKVLYIGVTNNLERRIYQHKNKLIKDFTEKYNVNKLVYFEQTNDIESAITREKEIKHWRREKKNRLIESNNKEWQDLTKNGTLKNNILSPLHVISTNGRDLIHQDSRSLTSVRDDRNT